MKKIFLLGIIIVLASSKMFAQDAKTQKTPEERAAFQTEWMQENLELSEAQTAQVGSLNLKYAQKMEQIKSIEGRISQLKEARVIHEEKNLELEQILSKEQFKTYTDKQKELRKKMREMQEQQ